MDKLAEITEQLNKITAQADEVVEAAKEDHSKLEEAKALIEGWKPEMERLTREREQAIRDEEYKSVRTEVSNLKDVIESLRKGPEGLLSVDEQGKGLAEDDPYNNSEYSIFNDIRLANKGVVAARERLLHGYENVKFEGKALSEEGKAMTEGTAAQGGYLVRPQVERQLVLARELDNVFRGLCSSLN